MIFLCCIFFFSHSNFRVLGILDMIWIWLFILIGYDLLTYTLSTLEYLEGFFFWFNLVSDCPLSNYVLTIFRYANDLYWLVMTSTGSLSSWVGWQQYLVTDSLCARAASALLRRSLLCTACSLCYKISLCTACSLYYKISLCTACSFYYKISRSVHHSYF